MVRMNKSLIIRSAIPEFALSLLSFIFLVVMIIFNIFLSRYMHWLNLAVFSLPMVFFLLIAWLRITNKMRKRVSAILLVFFTLVFVVVMFFNLIFMMVLEATSETKDVGEYGKIMFLYNQPKNKSLAHFPKELPKTASEIRFFEQPQFLQGGSSIFLRYKTSVEELNLLSQKYSKTAKVVLKSGEYDWDSYKNNGQNKDISLPGVFDEAIGYSELPGDFDIIVIDSKPYQTNNWNHGYTYGLAISKQKQEVLFWSEEW